MFFFLMYITYFFFFQRENFKLESDLINNKLQKSNSSPVVKFIQKSNENTNATKVCDNIIFVCVFFIQFTIYKFVLFKVDFSYSCH